MIIKLWRTVIALTISVAALGWTSIGLCRSLHIIATRPKDPSTTFIALDKRLFKTSFSRVSWRWENGFMILSFNGKASSASKTNGNLMSVCGIVPSVGRLRVPDASDCPSTDLWKTPPSLILPHQPTSTTTNFPCESVTARRIIEKKPL